MNARDVLGGPLATVVEGTIRRMEIAEDEIAAAKRRCPRRAKSIDAAFLLLCPNDYLRGGDELYRAHCRELLGRVKRDENVEPATDAEIAFAMSQASLAAPPTQDFALAYAKVFARVFPEHADLVEDVGREHIPGRSDEIIADLRRKIGRDIGRKLK